jgi:hypothetical protein
MGIRKARRWVTIRRNAGAKVFIRCWRWRRQTLFDQAVETLPAKTSYSLNRVKSYASRVKPRERSHEKCFAPLGEVFTRRHEDVSTTMIYTHVMGQGGCGMKSPLDNL